MGAKMMKTKKQKIRGQNSHHRQIHGQNSWHRPLRARRAGKPQELAHLQQKGKTQPQQPVLEDPPGEGSMLCC
ncbi:unnamed protein product [Amoebophrya sp. A25]|nr:unnamed protein product [Amoebophrya sp. A25]|eukprot:GSA25T00014442001.1